MKHPGTGPCHSDVRGKMEEGKGVTEDGRWLMLDGRVGVKHFYRISEVNFVHFIVIHKVILLILSYFTNFIRSFYRNLKLF